MFQLFQDKPIIPNNLLSSRDYWMKDNTSKECFSCGKPFTTFRRRHHCRLCGQIFCNDCTALISGQKFQYNGMIRLCNSCLSYDYDSSDDEDVEEDADANEGANELNEGISTIEEEREVVEEEEEQSVSDDDDSDDEPMKSETVAVYEAPRALSESNLRPVRSSHNVGSQVGLARRRSRLKSRTRRDSEVEAPKNGMRSSAAVEKEEPVYKDLNHMSVYHLEKFIRQTLKQFGIKRRKLWQETLIGLLQAIHNIRQDPKNGDYFDITRYIKVKKVAGSSPSSSKCYNGLIFTKNLASTAMRSKIKKPNVLLVNFPLSYPKSGHNKFISFEQVRAQEKEYLDILVKRISAFGPPIDMVISGSEISGYVLESLIKLGVSVLYNVKYSTLERLSRLLDCDIVNSFEKLATNPKLGSCGLFEVRSFVHKNIKKTFMFFTETKPSLGYTVLLRGGSDEVLKSVKNILEFSIYMMFHLSLETSLFRSEFLIIPKVKEVTKLLSHRPYDGYCGDFLKSLDSKIFSISPTVKIPVPHLLQRARNCETSLIKFHESYDPNDVDVASARKIANEFGITWLDQETDEYLLNVVKIVLSVRSRLLKNSFKSYCRQWETFSQSMTQLLETSFHQSISFLYSTINTKNQSHCVFPKIRTCEYYMEATDIPLGQYIETLISTSGQFCDEGCGSKLMDHNFSYVHGDGVVTVSLENIQSKIPGFQGDILMWSTCKTCDHSTPVLPINDLLWKFSFGKFLELSFLSLDFQVSFEDCNHGFRERTRCFELNGTCLKFDYNKIDLLELVVPGNKVYWKPEVDNNLKTEIHRSIQEKASLFFKSVLNRLEGVKIDNSNQENADDAKIKIKELIELAKENEQQILNDARTVFNETSPLEYLPLNVVLKDLQNMSVAWDDRFSSFEEEFLPSENDITRITAFQLSNFFKEKKGKKDSDDEDEDIEESFEKTENEKKPEKADEIYDEKHDNGGDGEKETGEKKPDENVESIPNKNDVEKSKTDSNDVYLVPSERQNIVSEESGPPSATSEPTTKSSDENIESEDAKLSGNKEGLKSDDDVSSDATEKNFDGAHSPSSGKKDNNSPSPKYPSVLDKVSQMQARLNSEAARTKRDMRGFPSTYSRSKFPMFNTSNLLKTELINKTNLRDYTSNDLTNSRRVFSNTKVTQLKDYYDQMHIRLNKEFALERENERKKIASRYRAMPLISSVPTVKVYEDFEDAMRSRFDKKSPNLIDLKIDEPKVKEVSGSEGVDEQEGVVESKEQQDNVGSDENKYDDNNNDNEQHGSTLGQIEIGESDDESEDKKVKDAEVGTSPTTKSGLSHSKDSVDDSSIKLEQVSQDNDTKSTKSKKEVEIPQQEKNSLLSAIKKFWADRSVLWKPLDYPLDGTEHVFVDSNVIVREDEPSSLIAYSLSTNKYIQTVQGLRSSKKSSHVSETSQDAGHEGNPNTLEDEILNKSPTHLSFSVTEGSASLTCKIFFVSQFEALREACGSNFIQSLSRCVKWSSTGGKSGSAFLKTLDDRFVIKQLSEAELDSFVKMAFSYFEFVSRSLFHDLPSVISKIFGFYQIGIKNPVSGRNMNMNVIIMENLFYDRKNLRIFDLKGSMRNRHVEKTGKENEVLLDENMVDYIYESPLFMRLHSKKLLRVSLWNDTLFLGKMNVMDYSLVIGIDTEKNEIVAGIIDYIRTFTWDKKLESWVKEKGLVGGGGKRPTVVTPKQYKTRFRAAMDRYMLLVPDRFYSSDQLQ